MAIITRSSVMIIAYKQAFALFNNHNLRQFA